MMEKSYYEPEIDNSDSHFSVESYQNCQFCCFNFVMEINELDQSNYLMHKFKMTSDSNYIC